eukprot:TRINITY_DN9864_c0_g1_i1.p1 TRINITY_DN9864_c0_g1~~TRINITY_DN9864_c0_g1_i1.p1  ORF type:complete len:353 (+),score=38.90 TRINITY_DN9864_c0_g1_i1:36-1094(+)
MAEPTAGAFCGECGQSMSTPFCGATGNPHALMKLYSANIVPDRSQSSGSTRNPLDDAFPGGPSPKQQRIADPEIMQLGKGGSLYEDPTKRETKNAEPGAAEQRLDYPSAYQMNGTTKCFGVGGNTIIRISIILCIVTFGIAAASLGVHDWYFTEMAINSIDAVDDRPEFLSTTMTYGLFKMCNATTYFESNTTVATTVENCDKDVEFRSLRCATTAAEGKLVGSKACGIAGCVMTVLVMVLLALSVFNKRRRNVFQILAAVASSIASLLLLLTPSLFMGIVESSYCDTYNLCEVLTWTHLSVIHGYATRSASCSYGGSLYISWIAAASSFVTSCVVILFVVFKKTHAKGIAL